MTTKIIHCINNCNSPFQDEQYGEGKRVFNKSEKEGTYSCTVCGKQHTSIDLGKKKKGK